MENYTSEKEQIEQIRTWWADNGNAILLGLALGLSGLFGYRYWQSNQNHLAEEASINYEHFLTIASAGSGKEVEEEGDTIIKAYPKTSYAKLTALVLAKLEIQNKKPEAAQRRLQWVIDNSTDGELKRIAQARLAQLLLAQDNVDGAAAIIGQLALQPDSSQFAELRADILAAQGKTEEARALYEKALAAIAITGADPSLLELKLDSLGLTSVADPK